MKTIKSKNRTKKVNNLLSFDDYKPIDSRLARTFNKWAEMFYDQYLKKSGAPIYSTLSIAYLDDFVIDSLDKSKDSATREMNLYVAGVYIGECLNHTENTRWMQPKTTTTEKIDFSADYCVFHPDDKEDIELIFHPIDAVSTSLKPGKQDYIAMTLLLTAIRRQVRNEQKMNKN
jgi:hypothetical protein